MKLECGILELSSYKKYEYGGHWHWLSSILIPILGIDELSFRFCKPNVGYFHTLHDGQQHSLFMGFVWVGWEGSPYLDL